MPSSKSDTLQPNRRSVFAIVALAVATSLTSGCAGHHVPDIQIVPRSQWADTDPVLERLVEHTPQRLTIHHAGVMDDGTVAGDEVMRRLLRFSLEQKPWGDVPYHFIIDRTGCIRAGRAMKYAPDTNTGYDVEGHIGICVNGDLTRQPLIESQYRSLVDLLVKLSADLDVSNDRIAGHMDYSPGKTACPGSLETYIKNGWLLEDMERVRLNLEYQFRVANRAEEKE